VILHPQDIEKLETAYQSYNRKLIDKSNRESADQYRTCSCLGLLKNKPQINADERRLIESEEEISILNCIPILSHHIFNTTHSSHNHCL
jgi:hypothetical protein